MQDPSFLQRGFNVRIEPAYVLMDTLIVMRQISDSAVLYVKNSKIQLWMTTANRGAYVALDMDASLTAVSSSWNSNGYAIRVDLINWIPRLRSPISQQPTSSLHFYKTPGSPSLNCFVGNYGQPVNLGEVHFGEPNGIGVNDHDCHLRVHMSTQCLREVMEKFTPRYQKVLLIVYNGTLHWNVESRSIVDQNCMVEGLEAGTSHNITLHWEWPLYQVLSSASKSHPGDSLASFFLLIRHSGLLLDSEENSQREANITVTLSNKKQGEVT
ncbi:hypothetical protein V2J09_003783 [Rumex salicifolius]